MYFEQPEPVTTSEKAAVKFKPQLAINYGCLPFSAVNPTGITSGGKAFAFMTDDYEACKDHTVFQVYGRAAWYQDVWAIMYAWYFPAGFWSHVVSRRHDWASVVVWIDNPDLETPKVLGLSMSTSDNRYKTKDPAPSEAFDGNTPRFVHGLRVLGAPYVDVFESTGDPHTLIMWEQLNTDAARVALNDTDFGTAKVPFNDYNFVERLDKAWPF